MAEWGRSLAHQNRTIAIASDFRVDGAKSPETERRGFGLRNRSPKSQIARLSVALLNRNAALLSLVSEIAAISGVHDAHHNCRNRCNFGALRVEGKRGQADVTGF